MKKQLLAGLIGASLSVSAFADPTLYGKANVSLHNASEGDEDTTELVSNASRLGIKGSQTVSDSLEAIYQAEYQLYFDDAETFTQRNIFVGLKGSFGTVKAGKFDSPLKEAQNKVDLFNDLVGDINNSLVTVNDNRPDNIVSYESPSFSGFSGKAAIISSEEDGVDDGFSGAVAFEQNGLYGAVAFDRNVEAEDVDVVRVVAQYSFGDFQVGGLFEQVDVDGADDKLDGAFASFQYTIDKLVLKAQAGQSDIVEEEGETVSFGVDYKLADKVKVFGYFTQYEGDVESDNDYLGLGIEVGF